MEKMNLKDLRFAHEALAQVGLSVNVVDPYILTITNLDQRPLRVTREQAHILVASLAVILAEGRK